MVSLLRPSLQHVNASYCNENMCVQRKETEKELCLPSLRGRELGQMLPVQSLIAFSSASSSPKEKQPFLAHLYVRHLVLTKTFWNLLT